MKEGTSGMRGGAMGAGESGGGFDERVWALCRLVPRGRVTTYGAIAEALGRPGAARAVGGAMNRNPYAPEVPCHRVVGSGGRLTGYAGGLGKKRAMLEAEGVGFEGDRVAEGYMGRIERRGTGYAWV